MKLKIKVTQDCALIVSSCDSYQDLWVPFFNLKSKFWPDCPFNTFLVSESIVAKIPNMSSMPAGKGLEWSSILKSTIKKVNTPYVLLTMEDFFLQSPVDTEEVLELFEYVKKNNVNMLRLIPGPGKKFKKSGLSLREIPKDVNYRVSGQAAFWKSSVLIDLLVSSETLWEFEERGTIRARNLDGFFAVSKPALTYRHHVVERGKWFPWSAQKFKQMNIGVDFSRREVMSFKETVIWLLNKLCGPFATRLPKKIRSVLKPTLRRLTIIR